MYIGCDLPLLNPRATYPSIQHVRMGDNNSSEYPASPSPPPSTTNPQHADKTWASRLKQRRQKLLFRGFERPSLSRIAILTALCLITYPAFHILTLVAKDDSLFVVRFIVSVWCSAIGFALGYILLKIGARHLEAASESMLTGCRNFPRLYFKQLGPR